MKKLYINICTKTFKKCLHFSICACHPCAGAMLIFSVSIQFLLVPNRSWAKANGTPERVSFSQGFAEVQPSNIMSVASAVITLPTRLKLI